MTDPQTTAAARGIPTVRYVDHAGYTVPDLEAAVAFFVNVLGCELLYTTALEEGALDVTRGDELALTRTTDPGRIAKRLADGGPLLVLCTYDSSRILAQAMAAAGVQAAFDLAIADEAHRCAGLEGRTPKTILDADAIPAKRRLFMTATPTVFATRDRIRAQQRNVRVASMDDEHLFGPIVYHLPFAEAVSLGLLTPYQVAVIPVTDDGGPPPNPATPPGHRRRRPAARGRQPGHPAGHRARHAPLRVPTHRRLPPAHQRLQALRRPLHPRDGDARRARSAPRPGVDGARRRRRDAPPPQGPDTSPLRGRGAVRAPPAQQRQAAHRWRRRPWHRRHRLRRHPPRAGPHASLAAEAAALQGRHWEMHDLLFHRQKALADDDLVGYARQLDLDRSRFDAERSDRPCTDRVQRDIDSGLRVGVRGTPTLFLDGQRLSRYGLDALPERPETP